MSTRNERLTAALADAELDALVVDSLVNVRYLTGFTGSSGLVVAAPDRLVFITDFRYVEQAAEQVSPEFEHRRAAHDLVEEVGDVIPSGEVRLGFDDRCLSVHEHGRLRELLPDRVTLVAAGGLVEKIRAVKDEGEVAVIAAASELAEAAFNQVLERGIVGRTEREVALELENAMRAAGAQRPSFDSIVAGGPHGARPHASPREVPIEPETLVVFDWGAVLDGYCSDCTRTVATGTIDDEAREVYELVLGAQQAGVDAVRSGASGREVDGAARAIIDSAGHGQHFGHGLGHGVGAEVHEAPTLSVRSDDTLSSGNVVTIEPGVYLPGRFGVRIEDLVVVADGGVRNLCSLPKELTTVS